MVAPTNVPVGTNLTIVAVYALVSVLLYVFEANLADDPPGNVIVVAKAAEFMQGMLTMPEEAAFNTGVVVPNPSEKFVVDNFTVELDDPDPNPNNILADVLTFRTTKSPTTASVSKAPAEPTTPTFDSAEVLPKFNDDDVDAEPDKAEKAPRPPAAVITLAAKLPDSSRATIVEGVLRGVAVVAELATKLVAVSWASLEFAMAADDDIIALVMTPDAICVADCVPVTWPARAVVNVAADPDTFPVTSPIKLDKITAELSDVNAPVSLIIQ
jgi:hypothetical protein